MPFSVCAMVWRQRGRGKWCCPAGAVDLGGRGRGHVGGSSSGAGGAGQFSMEGYLTMTQKHLDLLAANCCASETAMRAHVARVVELHCRFWDTVLFGFLAYDAQVRMAVAGCVQQGIPPDWAVAGTWTESERYLPYRRGVPGRCLVCGQAMARTSTGRKPGGVHKLEGIPQVTAGVGRGGQRNPREERVLLGAIWLFRQCTLDYHNITRWAAGADSVLQVPPPLPVTQSMLLLDQTWLSPLKAGVFQLDLVGRGVGEAA